MKQVILALSLLSTLSLIGCGDNSSPAATVSPVPTVAPVVVITPTPSPTPTPAGSLVGNWIDIKSDELDIHADNTVTSNGQKLIWAGDQSNISFSDENVLIDTCTYQITSTGNLISPITIILELVCTKSGLITYSQK